MPCIPLHQEGEKPASTDKGWTQTAGFAVKGAAFSLVLAHQTLEQSWLPSKAAAVSASLHGADGGAEGTAAAAKAKRLHCLQFI